MSYHVVSQSRDLGRELGMIRLMGAAWIPTSVACPWLGLGNPYLAGFISALPLAESSWIYASGTFDAPIRILIYWEP